MISTYNGEKYLREQLDSVLAQKNVDLHVLVRDDGSSDSTLEILEEYSAKDNRLSYYRGENVGPAHSFLDLMYQADGTDFYALCDQDDVWDEDKLEIAINGVKKLDQSKPALYYCNLRLVDCELHFLRNAFQTSQDQKNKYAALLENKATGCTCVYNIAASEMFKVKIPEYCSMHDTWVYLVCKLMGSAIYDSNPHMSYRQHGNNVIGATVKKNSKWYIDRAKRFINRSYQPRYFNALSLVDCLGDRMNPTDLAKVKEITEYKESLSKRLKFMFDEDFRTSSLSRVIRDRLLILFGII